MLLAAFALQQAPKVAEQVVSYVGEFVLGGIALLALAVAYWAIKELKAAKNEHIKALNDASMAKDSTNKDHAEAYQRTATATVSAIEKLMLTETTQTDAIRENTRALQDLRGAVDGQTKTIDSVLRDAVRRRSGNWTAVGGPKPAPEGGE